MLWVTRVREQHNHRKDVPRKARETFSSSDKNTVVKTKHDHALCSRALNMQSEGNIFSHIRVTGTISFTQKAIF